MKSTDQLQIAPSHNPFKTDTQLFFMHIPKTAGTSFTELLEQPFSNVEICPPDRHYHRLLETYNADKLNQFKVFRGHFPYQLRSKLREKTIMLTFLRDPIRRTISHFQHLQRLEPEHEHYHEPSTKMSLAQFLEESPLLPLVLNKPQQYLTFEKVIEINSNHPNLELSKQRLSEFNFLGITERFEQSLELFAYQFGLPDIKYLPKKNIAPKSTPSEQLTQSTIERIVELNKDEIELYQYAQDIFEQKYAQMLKEKSRASEISSISEQIKGLHWNGKPVYPGQGWYTAEKHPLYGLVRWTGPETTSILHISLLPTQSYEIYFLVVNVLEKEIINSLTLHINGHAIELFAEPAGDYGQVKFVGTIPQTILSSSQLSAKFVFSVNHTISPDDIHQNGDVRRLGICFCWIHIHPA